MTVRHASNRNPDGLMLGQSATDKVGFFGKTPVVQQTASATPTLAELGIALRALGLLAP